MRTTWVTGHSLPVVVQGLVCKTFGKEQGNSKWFSHFSAILSPTVSNQRLNRRWVGHPQGLILSCIVSVDSISWSLLNGQHTKCWIGRQTMPSNPLVSQKVPPQIPEMSINFFWKQIPERSRLRTYATHKCLGTLKSIFKYQMILAAVDHRCTAKCQCSKMFQCRYSVVEDSFKC